MSHNRSQSGGVSKQGVSGRFRVWLSWRFPKTCGSSLAVELENGNSSTRRLSSTALSWWISCSTGFSRGGKRRAGNDGPTVWWSSWLLCSWCCGILCAGPGCEGRPCWNDSDPISLILDGGSPGRFRFGSSFCQEELAAYDCVNCSYVDARWEMAWNWDEHNCCDDFCFCAGNCGKPSKLTVLLKDCLLDVSFKYAPGRIGRNPEGPTAPFFCSFLHFRRRFLNQSYEYIERRTGVSNR